MSANKICLDICCGWIWVKPFTLITSLKLVEMVCFHTLAYNFSFYYLRKNINPVAFIEIVQ